MPEAAAEQADAQPERTFDRVINVILSIRKEGGETITKTITCLQALLEYAHALPWECDPFNRRALRHLGAALEGINEDTADVASDELESSDVGRNLKT